MPLTQSLYDLVVDSLSALILCTKIKEQFHIPFGVSRLLQFSCILELSDYIAAETGAAVNFEEEF